MSELENNLRDIERLLAPLSKDVLPHFINGKRDPGRSGKTFDGYTPVDNSVIGKVAAGNADDIDAACQAAAAAFEEWREMPGDERKKILHKIADAIVENATDIALIESYDSGQAIKFMSKAAIRSAANFRFFADKAPVLAMAGRYRLTNISITLFASRSGLLVSSRHGIHRSCCRPGRLHRRSLPDVRSCINLPSGHRTRR